MAEIFLSCNASGCNKKLFEEAYVTSCSHIYCTDHGQRMLNKALGSCLMCGTKFSSQYDFLLAKLKPSEKYKSIVLNGLNPEQVLDIASRAISFFTYQMSVEAQMKVTALKNVGRQQEETCISMSSTYKAELTKMQRFADSLKKELEEKMKEVEYHKDKITQLMRANKKLQSKVETYKREIIFQKTSTEPPEQLFGSPMSFNSFFVPQGSPNSHKKHSERFKPIFQDM